MKSSGRASRSRTGKSAATVRPTVRGSPPASAVCGVPVTVTGISAGLRAVIVAVTLVAVAGTGLGENVMPTVLEESLSRIGPSDPLMRLIVSVVCAVPPDDIAIRGAEASSAKSAGGGVTGSSKERSSTRTGPLEALDSRK